MVKTQQKNRQTKYSPREESKEIKKPKKPKTKKGKETDNKRPPVPDRDYSDIALKEALAFFRDEPKKNRNEELADEAYKKQGTKLELLEKIEKYWGNENIRADLLKQLANLKQGQSKETDLGKKLKGKTNLEDIKK